MVEKVRIGFGLWALVIAIVVAAFVVGVLVGFFMDTMREDFLVRELMFTNIEAESFSVGQLYLVDHPNYCGIAETYISKIAKSTEQLEKDLGMLESKMMLRNTSYIDQRYFLHEIRFWLAAERYKSACGINISTVLFFYGDDDEPSYEQGLVLTALKKEFGRSLLVFSFRRGFPDPTLRLIEEDFNITKVPTLIINGKKYEELQDKNALKKILGLE